MKQRIDRGQLILLLVHVRGEVSSEVISILVDRSLEELAHLKGMARQEMGEEGVY